MRQKRITSIAAAVLAAGCTLGLAGTASAAEAGVPLWARYGHFGTMKACELNGVSEVAVGHARAWYCEREDRVTGSVYVLYLDYI